MKKIELRPLGMTAILLLCAVFCQAQDTCKCDSGYSCMPAISTTSLIIEGGHCLPDSTVKKMWNMFSKNLCGETGMAIMELGEATKYYTPLSYSDTHTWSDSLGCISKETWRKKVRGVWIDIKKEEYDKISALNKRNNGRK